MNPEELVKRDLQIENSDTVLSVKEIPDQSPFSQHRLFVVHGPTKRFDFPTLPGGSMGYYAANGHTATRLTRQSKEIESVLSADWKQLASTDPVLLASLILRFYDGGIHASHHVLKNLEALLCFGDSQRPFRDYELNEKALSKVKEEIGSTEAVQDSDALMIRAITLCGWMHDKRNLGIESFAVARDGRLSFQKRHVLSRKIFSRVPMIRY